MPKKYGPLQTSTIDPEEYDIIYGEGYAECLKDMIKGLRDIKAQVDQFELDPIEQLDNLIEAAVKQLNEESQSVN